jgi:hypothetical protein
MREQKMEPKKLRTESGQILVILVVALVVLLAFTALAIDVGMTYSDRRYDQSAADAAALAGAQAAAIQMRSDYYDDPNHVNGSTVSFVCSSQPAWVQSGMAKAAEGAIARAGTNGFALTAQSDLTNLQNAQQGVYVDCCDQTAINNSDGDCATHAEMGVFVHVMLSSTSATSFTHLVFGGPLRNTVTSVARVQPAGPMYFGQAIISLNENCDNGNKNDGGTFLSGNHELKLNGGGMHSNSCITNNGNSGTVQISDGAATYNGDSYIQFNGKYSCPEYTTNFNPCPIPGDLVPRIDVTADCSSFDDAHTYNSLPNNATTLSPGVYNFDPRLTGKKDIFMNPGLYCFNNGFSVESNFKGKLTGNGVTIYMSGANSAIKIAGATQLDLTPPTVDTNGVPTTGTPPAILGMLILYPPTNHSDIDIDGTGNSILQGTIYAPYSVIHIGGNGSICSITDQNADTNCTVQIVGDTIDLSGTTDININYDASKDAVFQPIIDLRR